MARKKSRSGGSLAKAEGRRNERITEGYWNHTDHGRRRRKKPVFAEPSPDRSPEAKVVKLAERVAKADAAGRTDRAYGLLVDGICEITRPCPAFTGVLLTLFSEDDLPPLSNKQAKRLSKTTGWRSVRGVRSATAYWLGLSGRIGLADKLRFQELSPALSHGERKLLDQLCGDSTLRPTETPEDEQRDEPVGGSWTALQWLGGDCDIEEDEPLAQVLHEIFVQCPLSHLRMDPEEREALILDTLRAALEGSVATALTASLWALRELGADDPLATPLREVCRDLLHSSQVSEQELTELISGLISGGAGEGVMLLDARLQALRSIQPGKDDHSYVHDAMSFASNISASDADWGPLRLEHLRHALRCDDAIPAQERRHGSHAAAILKAIGEHDQASDAERERAREELEYEGEEPADRAIRELEKALAAEPEKSETKVSLAGELFRRGRGRKIVSDQIRAVGLLAQAIETGIEGHKAYELIEEYVDLAAFLPTKDHARLRVALEQTAAAAPWSAALTMRLACADKAAPADRQADLAAQLSAAVEQANSKGELEACARAGAKLGLVKEAADADAKAWELLDESKAAAVSLEFIESGLTRFQEASVLDDERFKRVVAVIGAQAHASVAARFRALADFGSATKVNEAGFAFDPKHDECATGLLLSVGQSRVPQEEYLQAADRVIKEHPDLSRVAGLLHSVLYDRQQSREDAEQKRQQIDQELFFRALRRVYKMREPEVAAASEESEAHEGQPAIEMADAETGTESKAEAESVASEEPATDGEEQA